ncbi:uncharacterized protein LOC110988664 [Acanthaster planci]|uniref:Uncharacterized protein LOC110988664 n=1 Tax=Acanthaster planci TaxID=133434 RepID=A0A8B7ZTG5_ACAPL|nr:uncharacterized protein LOC110988664 [Acanthaster planci]
MIAGKRLDVMVHIEDTMDFYMGSDWCVRLSEGLSRFSVNGEQGWGVCQTLTGFTGHRLVPATLPVPKLYREPDIASMTSQKPMILPLTASSCQVSSLTGGKGSQLAKLVALRRQQPVEYEVPSGFCITTAAFRMHLRNNDALQRAVTELKEVSCTLQEGDLMATCERTTALIAKTDISDRLKAEIDGMVAEIFDDAEGSKMYAVRSSAVGEDTSLTSAAGQMDTFLGINGMEKVFEAIPKCWASNFSFQAVQYRRQYGQAVDAAMAVVVQEIVTAESAGVAFSRDPMTGNPAKIVINSNYGLGELDECFSDARDIEWAVVGDTIYLLQARAVTTFNVPSRYELLHEFDSGLPLDDIWMSTANIQEMCPGAVSPLTLSNFFVDCDVIDHVTSVLAIKRPISCPAVRNILVGYNHAFLSLTNIVSMFIRMTPLQDNQFGGMLYGQAFDKDCIIKGKQLNEPHLPAWRMRLNGFRFMLRILFTRSTLEREFAKAVTHLTRRWETAQEQYDDICRYPNDRSEILEYHAMETHKSAILQQVVGSLISKYTDENLLPSHIALLLSSCPDVESAKVPLAMETVAKAILREGKNSSFQTMAPLEALQWLQSPSSGEAGTAFSDFLRRHGHRCVREVELRDKSWSMEPLQVIPSLQAILASGSHKASEKKTVLSAAEAVNQLGLAIPALLRKILVTYLVPKAREGVAARESGKSKFIMINHRLKEAYWRLANLMVKEGRLPDEDLLFFFTPNEIGRFLRDRSPALVARALRRRRLLPEMNGLRFKLVFSGRPEPILEEEDVATEFKLEGTPISQGTVKSTARVVTYLKDANNIKKGDILITRITDIGWSPYFPLISGLVTEIGGVLSHGAVVAREYGIPCVVNVQRATRVFKSDDLIVLNGGLGTVEKIGTPSEVPPTASTEKA